MPKRYSAKYSWTKRVGSFILHPSDRAAVMRELDGHIEDRIEAYIEDEVFWETVKNSYKDIDLSNKKDKERFIAKRQKTADWLRKQANGIYF